MPGISLCWWSSLYTIVLISLKPCRQNTRRTWACPLLPVPPSDNSGGGINCSPVNCGLFCIHSSCLLWLCPLPGIPLSAELSLQKNTFQGPDLKVSFSHKQPDRAKDWTSQGWPLGWDSRDPTALAGSCHNPHYGLSLPFLWEPDTPSSNDLRTLLLDQGSYPPKKQEYGGGRGYVQPDSCFWGSLCLRAHGTGVPVISSILGCWPPLSPYMGPLSWFLSLGLQASW